MSGKKLGPFDVLFAITKKKIFSKEEVQKAGLSSYLLLNYLKSNNVGVCIAEYLNRNWKIPLYDQYLFAVHILPPQVKYISYAKSEKIVPDDELELIRKHYHVSEDIAREYHALIEQSQLDSLKKMYKTIGA